MNLTQSKSQQQFEIQILQHFVIIPKIIKHRNIHDLPRNVHSSLKPCYQMCHKHQWTYYIVQHLILLEYPPLKSQFQYTTHEITNNHQCNNQHLPMLIYQVREEQQ